jgi:NAD(P)-dependent dehydrogenase (short-subunit alcohol dehydrogenase family)
MKLENKVAVIAGGTKGIGLGIALEFAREGARVVVGGTNPKNGETAESEIAAAGGDGLFVKCDVSNLDDLTVRPDNGCEPARHVLWWPESSATNGCPG